MAHNTLNLSLKVPSDVLRGLDEIAAELSVKADGCPVSRSKVARMLLLAGYNARRGNTR